MKIPKRIVIETNSRLHGAEAFVKAMRDGLPTLAATALQELKRSAEEAGWEYEDYTIENQILEHTYEDSIPEFAAFAAVILIDSIIETQLDAFCTFIQKERNLHIGFRDMRGQGIERAALYLKLVAAIDLKIDPAWGQLHDLHALRNIVVHRGGKRGTSPDHQKEFDRVVGRYPADLKNKRNSPLLQISFDLCLTFSAVSQEFFDRVFVFSGLRT